MPKNREDAIADEVRRKLQEALASGNVNSGRVSLEILYLLPTEFTRMYTQLFDMALSWAPSGGSDGGRDSGQIKAKVKNTGMKTRQMGGAQAGGKRFVERRWAIRDDRALEEKRKLDKVLVAAVQRAIRAAAPEGTDSAGGQSGSRAVSDQGTGNIKDTSTNRNKGLIRCRACGRGLANGWVRCPFHGGESGDEERDGTKDQSSVDLDA